MNEINWARKYEFAASVSYQGKRKNKKQRARDKRAKIKDPQLV